MTTKTFRVENAVSGHVFGTYSGETAEQAITAMMRDAGSDEEPSEDLVAVEVEPVAKRAIRSIIYAGNCVDDPSEITEAQWDALAEMTEAALSAAYPGADVEVEIKRASGYGSGTTIDGERSEDAKVIAERAWQSWLETLGEPTGRTDEEPETYSINSFKGRRDNIASIADAITAARLMDAELQPAMGVDIYRDDTRIATYSDGRIEWEDEATDAYRAGYMDGQTTAEEVGDPSKLLGDGASDALVNSLTGRELGQAIGLTAAQVEERGEDFKRALGLYDRGYADAVRAAVEAAPAMSDREARRRSSGSDLRCDGCGEVIAVGDARFPDETRAVFCSMCDDAPADE